MRQFIEAEYENMLKTLRELCAIPAPSGREEQRAAYVKRWLENAGAENVYIDDALNVIYPVNCGGEDGFTVFCAHSDTVFPDLTPMPVTEDDVYIASPGVGDDTASVVVLLYSIRYLLQNDLLKKRRVMFVINSGEEGLGNLRGTRFLFETFGKRIKSFISYDAEGLSRGTRDAVGSHRYKVKATTEGGHSFGAFGHESAVHALARIICAIYAIEVPRKTGTRTTYNVGTIEGGTSVNTIPQRAEMLCEYRSDDRECLAIMRQKFEDIFRAAQSEKVGIEVTPVGERPCSGDFDRAAQQKLMELVAGIEEEITGTRPKFGSGSTDCNIPLSLGVNALCIGVYNGSGAHTREERVEKASLKPGLAISIQLILRSTEA